MIDRNYVAHLEREMEDCFRGYSRALNNRKAAVDRAMICAMKDEPIPFEIKANIVDADWDIDYYPRYLAELKAKYIEMIETINLPTF